MQHELELPHIAWPALSRALDTELKFVLCAVAQSARWSTIITNGLRRWIQYPRDVVRFANALRFAWPSVRSEVDAADVLAMEGFRLFEPDIFDWIKRNRDFLIEPNSFLSEAEQKAKVAALRETLDAGRGPVVMELLALLFSRQSSQLQPDDRLSGADSWPEAVSRGGVATARGYDAYFSLFPSPYLVPKDLVDRAAAAPDDSAIQTEAIKKACDTLDATGRSLIGDYLDELLYRFAMRQRIKAGLAMFQPLLGVAPFIHAQKPKTGMSFAAWISFHQLLRGILEQHSINEADSILLEAVRSCDSAEALATLYVWRAREAGQLPRESNEHGPVISDDALGKLGAATLQQIERAFADGRLSEASFYSDIMTVWSSLGSAEAAKCWLDASIMEDAHTLSKATEGFLGSTTADDGSTVYLFHGFREDRGFYDAATFAAAAEKFADASDLSSDETKRIGSRTFQVVNQVVLAVWARLSVFPPDLNEMRVDGRWVTQPQIVVPHTRMF